jgi:hypothetical protein
VAVAVLAGEIMVNLSISLKRAQDKLVHDVAVAAGRDVPGYYHARVIFGKWKDSGYQNGDVILIFTATAQLLDAVRNARTEPLPKEPKKSTSSAKTKPPSQPGRDWLNELSVQRGEEYETDSIAFGRTIDVETRNTKQKHSDLGWGREP